MENLPGYYPPLIGSLGFFSLLAVRTYLNNKFFNEYIDRRINAELSNIENLLTYQVYDKKLNTQDIDEISENHRSTIIETDAARRNMFWMLIATGNILMNYPNFLENWNNPILWTAAISILYNSAIIKLEKERQGVWNINIPND